MEDFTNKVVIVTGGSGALGSVVAGQFARHGATVVVLDIAAEGINRLQNELGEQCYGYVCDLTDEDEVKTTIDKIVTEIGSIDVLANIAGGFTMGGRTHETDLQTVEKMLDFNFRTMYTLSKYVLPNMLENKGGKIINIGARAGLEGSAEMGPYVGSKALVIRATETMAREYKGDNINVNCILPGTIDTERNRNDMPGADFSKWVPPSKLANVIRFLASDEASAINGASIPVYGGTL